MGLYTEGLRSAIQHVGHTRREIDFVPATLGKFESREMVLRCENQKKCKKTFEGSNR